MTLPRFMFPLMALIAVLFLALVIFVEPVPRFVRLLIVREPPTNSDAIVVLLGGTQMERAAHATSLFYQGISKNILFCDGFKVSGVKSLWHKKRGWVAYGLRLQKYFLTHGVPQAALIVISCPHIHDTASEIAALAPELRTRTINHVTVVTSASHSRRASLIWKRIAPDLRTTMTSTRDSRLEWWWSNKHGRTTVAYEYLALLKEFIRSIFATLTH